MLFVSKNDIVFKLFVMISKIEGLLFVLVNKLSDILLICMSNYCWFVYNVLNENEGDLCLFLNGYLA